MHFPFICAALQNYTISYFCGFAAFSGLKEGISRNKYRCNHFEITVIKQKMDFFNNFVLHFSWRGYAQQPEPRGQHYSDTVYKMHPRRSQPRILGDNSMLIIKTVER